MPEPHMEVKTSPVKSNGNSGVDKSLSDKIPDKSTQKTPAISRRRKLVACPLMAKKRQKISISEHKEKTDLESEKAASPPISRCAIIAPIITSTQIQFDDVQLDSNKLPPIENLLSPIHVVSQPHEINTMDHDSSSQFITLTPVTSTALEAGDCSIEAGSQDKINIPVSNSDVDIPKNNNVAVVSCNPSDVIDCPTGTLSVIKENTQTSITVDASKSLKPNIDKKVDYISNPKKSDLKAKQYSATAKHRSNAFKKLKQLKENQEDGNEWPEFDQNLVSMSDLIFLNPPNKLGLTLGMNVRQEEAREEILSQKEDQLSASSVEVAKSNSEEQGEDAALPVPQIRIADDGSIVVDEDSLVLDTQKPVDPKISTVYEFGKESTINQCSFMRRPYVRTAKWSLEETDKFYKCLCVVGAEFSLMGAMFRERTPDDLRRKFKRERKKNPNRIDKALMQQHLSKWTDDMFEPKLDNNDNSRSLNNKPSAEATVK
uniref:transcription factor TFIIIB component B'' homolog n=1 Tax=Styela clava TaxID=7725 RepID=UPI00193A2A0D|nr:transcription factor TFIIIB component B'' homolog [Styela clava]